MERAHIFFESLHSFLSWKSAERPLYVIQTQRTEPMSVSGITRVTHAISLSQVFSDVIHHLEFKVTTHLEPIDIEERDQNLERANLAWDILRTRLDDQFDNIVSGAWMAYPSEFKPLYAALPGDVIKEIRQVMED